MFWTGLRTRWNLRALRILGAAWKDGACAICSVEELQNCPEEKCTAELHEGALLDIWDSCSVQSVRLEEVQVDSFYRLCTGEGIMAVRLE